MRKRGRGDVEVEFEIPAFGQRWTPRRRKRVAYRIDLSLAPRNEATAGTPVETIVEVTVDRRGKARLRRLR